MRQAMISGVSLFLSLDSLAANLPFVDHMMADYDHPDAPGAAVVVVKDDQVLHMKGYGVADLEASISASDKTSFRLASVSKSFIGLAIAMLEADGFLSQSQNLLQFFPNFPEYGRNVSIHHLIHHLSGLVDYEDLIPEEQTNQLSDQDVLDLYVKKSKSTKFPPGSKYAYSNGGYVLLGLIIEQVSGRPLGEFLQDRIFRPLGMSCVMYEGESTPIAVRAFGYSRTSADWQRTDQSVTSATRGDGGIYASIADLLLWNRALDRKGDNPILSNDIVTKIFTQGALNSGAGCGYGYGWQLDSWRGNRRQAHTGSTIGFRTAFQRYPEHNLMIAVLTNRNGGAPWVFAERIAEQVLNLPAEN